MLKKINAGGVESSNGFTMQIVHPEYLEYKEGQKCIPISIGYEPNTRKTYIYVSDVTEVNIVERNKIANNIKEAVKLLDGTFEVI